MRTTHTSVPYAHNRAGERDEVRREVTIEKELELLPDKFLVRSRHSLRRCDGVQHTLQRWHRYPVVLESPRQRGV